MFLISFLRIMAPASIEVWISSPVRSRNPVLMNTTRSLAAAMQAARLALVRRSSSMIPIFSVACGRPRNCSTRVNISQAKAISSGPCILGFTIYTEPSRLLRRAFRSCIAISAVTAASSMPSGISAPAPSSTASVNMWWPTLRISIRLRPGSTTSPPPGAVNTRSGFSVRSSVLPPFSKLADRLPSIRPSQLR